MTSAATGKRPRISLIVARARNGVIGRAGSLPWRLPDDLAYFKELTVGHPIIMGRTTYESIGRPLPGRMNLILSRQPGLHIRGCEVFADLDAALARCAGAADVFVIGGAQIYQLAQSRADRWLVTEIAADVAGDVFLPAPDPAVWVEVSRRHHGVDERHALPFDWIEYHRDGAGG